MKEIKVYVEELPKNCKECPFVIDRGECNSSRLCFGENFVNCDCKLNPNMSYIGITKPHGCPLETTQPLKQQVREEVVEEIINAIDDKFNCLGYVEEKFEDIKKYILDQVKGEIKQ